MGLFFKKSKKFGLLKLNFSKSGIGLSFGVKGCRLSANSKGIYLNAGRNGIYYRKKISAKQLRKIRPEIKNEKQTVAIYGKQEITKFLIILSIIVCVTLILGFTLFIFNHPLRGGFIFACGFICLVVYIVKNLALYKEMIELGEKINELKSQNLDVEFKETISNPKSDDATQRRNESKYREYKYSYELYKVNNDK